MKFTTKRRLVSVNRSRLTTVLVLVCVVFCTACVQETPENTFRFVFMTDIHLTDELRAPEGFRAAIAHAEALDPDFVVTGGDLIMDATRVPLDEAVAQFELYREIVGSFHVPVFAALGNHEVFGLSPESGVAPEHPQYGKNLFRNLLGLDSTFYSFDHGGWHFIVLDAMTFTEDREYVGEIDSEQMAWLERHLAALDRETPIVVVSHFPFVSVGLQLRDGGAAALRESWVMTNSHEVLELFEEHDLRLVLQGHLHIVEEIVVGDVRFVTGGAVSGSWWEGPRNGFPEGFVVVDVSGDDLDWWYEPYGWQAAVPE
jgi:3',5'-cyclic AMP phosphodiesterase CpdA